VYQSSSELPEFCRRYYKKYFLLSFFCGHTVDAVENGHWCNMHSAHKCGHVVIADYGNVVMQQDEFHILLIDSLFTVLSVFQIEHKISLQQLAERLGVNFDVVCNHHFVVF